MSPVAGVRRANFKAKVRAGREGIGTPAPSKGSASRFLLALLGLLGVLTFLGLGIWQLERRAWKLDLIARVDQRIHAAVVDAPGPATWADINAAGYEYRHVRLTGRFIGGANTLVQAVTELGGGYWVLTPMREDRGFTVLVNRGFIPQERKAAFQQESGGPSSPRTIDGLLRISEPGGGFLRSNDPAADRWYSRDIAAIAKERRLTDFAPYFIDAGTSGADSWPRGGLTVVTFRNSHLVYALTWFALAAMLAVALARPILATCRRGSAAR
ncbi:SURF1 family protein [Mesorhizobium sp.]|jgi:surfeit locus 1 family protein|uniref:SURF1 family protein n=1 Tax=Mesorhizobium sp. TaxID=1871066 RepID=UPI000FE35E56|nr:SURF1 family protein [Mesorhizobium sp.]RWH68292.1 MAG: SURF1 family protein [Mesorhizobium sp.]RWL25130.1 MAG: SURF1 family protein [Mesorhizobium sp.]RWL27635.1 MAG: SURF1 family protein [Mesorhizobium sp.]RWL36281.1 MAG: SURF1 family protein [Mesorhizobium sp.]RWL50949.1 MAG: SURF1 family protein [Mesorhizobium sp.]